MRRSAINIDASRITQLRRTDAYDVYWKFAAERQEIFFRRLANAEAPWTADEILRSFKFTNAYRAIDRASQFLIRNVIYGDHYSNAPVEVAFRVLLFKLFNKVSTWQLLEQELGPLSWQSFSVKAYDRVLSKAASKGTRLYSAAYIVPPVSLDETGVKHRGHLRLIDLILRGDFVAKLQQTRHLREVFTLLKSFPSLGDFLAFQISIDLNYSELIDHEEASFVVAGPGARDGIAKVFPDARPDQAVSIIEMMMNDQEAEFRRLGLRFRSLWGRRLQLIDCQNLFCEVSKYTRVSHPHIEGVSGRTRIKQIFKPQQTLTVPWLPPKWGLNGKLPVYPDKPMPDLFARSS